MARDVNVSDFIVLLCSETISCNNKLRNVKFITKCELYQCGDHHFYYPPRAVFDPYRGIDLVGYILFVYNGTSVLWIISVNNFRFSPISCKLCNLQIYIIYHQKGLLTALLLVSVALKTHTEMAEKVQFKY